METQSVSSFYNSSTNIQGYFYRASNFPNYIFEVVKLTDKLEHYTSNILEVQIDFVPEDYVIYVFDVIEATSTFLYVKNYDKTYQINIVKELEQEKFRANIPELEMETNEPVLSNRYLSIINNYLDNSFQIESPKDDNWESEEDGFYDSDGYGEADGYDSEGYYFRLGTN